MNASATFRLLPAIVLFALLSACSGGSDNPTKPGGDGGGGGGGTGTTPLAAPANLSVVTQGLDRMPGGSRVLFQEDNHIQRITWTPLVPVQAPTGTTSR